jgi:HPt (histidine-containing phosphotransfer) domain-containing protein
MPTRLDGIDLVLGLRNLAGNQALYLKVLRRFRQTQGDVVLQLNAALSAGDNVGAARLAHTLKGLAGNIAARDLQVAASRVEYALSHNEVDLQPALKAVELALERVMRALAQLADEVVDDKSIPIVEAERSDPPNGARFEQLISQLTFLLDSGDASAAQFISTLVRENDVPERSVLLRELESAVGRYDFDAAKVYLSRFTKGS